MTACRRLSCAVLLLVACALLPAACSVEPYCFGCEADGGLSGGGLEGGAPPVGCAHGEACPSSAPKCCDGVCVDVATDVENCGECSQSCPTAPMTAVECVDGKCVTSCPSGLTDCNGVPADGCEANLQMDRLNCGKCGVICLYANATAKCSSGECTIDTCKEGFADCNKKAEDGCEINIGTDPGYCGNCDTTCPVVGNHEPLCLGGVCASGECLPGYGECNGVPGDGCETDLLGDAVNCGVCLNACPAPPHAEPGCQGGACSVGACEAGWADCDQSIWSGCETELATSKENCGACKAACLAVPDGYAACKEGKCVLGGCDPGRADCNEKLSDGCEVDLATDVAHCGACEIACPDIAHGKPACVGFACGIGSCDANYADCFGGSSDGCETPLLTDLANCGACGAACASIDHGTRTCKSGSCEIASCDPGYDDCNKKLPDGCEINLAADLANCGACNNACPVPAHAAAACKGGVCGLGACDAGYANCDGKPDNGCEQKTGDDPNNCGGCGIKCGSGSCAGGLCVCNKKVLLVADDSVSGSTTLTTALGLAGYAVTQTSVPSYQYNGSNPALAGFGSVVLLAGGPNATSYSSDMPAGGQNAIVSFVNASGQGLVLTEWAAFQVAGGRWQTLAPLVLLTRTKAFSGQVTYAVDGAFAGHPIWTGLPASFALASTSNVGSTKIAPFVIRAAGSPEAIDAVAVRDAPVGRVVHVAHAGNYAPNGWTNSNMQKLVANAVGWVARCK
ncbi:MAG: hypothetical protein HY744_10470 [Deltaproteobacteria bacterium]|nr:hypothetical protein [Deltaproteobacteria bacterium]